MNATVLIQVLTFGALVWLMKRVLWVPLTRLMEQRHARVAYGTAASERARYDLELARRRAGEIRAEARRQAELVIARAERVAAEVAETLKQQSRAEAQRLERMARREVAQELGRLRMALQAEARVLARTAAAQALGREQRARHPRRAAAGLEQGH